MQSNSDPNIDLNKEKSTGKGRWVCGTSNYQNLVRKFAKFPFTEPVMLIEYNLERNK